ncbi:MAG TPA: acyl-CoA dehydratase activase [Candidatus Angelobacter sp.]
MPLVAGIDCGTGFTKAMLLSQDLTTGQITVLGRGRARSGINVDEAATQALEEACVLAGKQRTEISYIAATGFGRYNLSFRDIAITEITTAARGVFFLYGKPGTVLDIGGQCTRAISVNEQGKVREFKSNDKCAAGSGMFIARAARYLEVPVEAIGELSMKAAHSQPISSICAVLAESEIINHVSSGVTVEDILRGIHESLADRAGALLKRVGLSDEITFIGGVARQQGMVCALAQRLHAKVTVPPDCDFVCALGAGVLGFRRLASRN